jgi:hypothetical protein
VFDDRVEQRPQILSRVSASRLAVPVRALV